MTTTPDETFTLPLISTGTYDFAITDDAGTDTITEYNQAEITRTYPSAGTHTVTITGTIIGLYFNHTGDRGKFYNISSFGPLDFGPSNGVFFDGCYNMTITATDVPIFTSTSMYGAFADTAVTNISNFNLWATGNINNWSYSFVNSDLDQDLGGVDLHSMTNGAAMLSGTTMSTENYDATWIGWKAQDDITPWENNVTFSGGSAKYTPGGAAEAARAHFATATGDGGRGWTILDSGPVT